MVRYLAFCKILEFGSFTRAAESLGYTQAAISQMISSLENELSLKLLVRTRAGIRLTPEGEKMYPLIQKSVAVSKELQNKVNEINGLESGEVRIGIFSSISQHVLPGLIKEFNKLYPRINFVLYQGDNKSLPIWLKSGMFDFAFIYPRAAAGLKFDVIAREQFLAVVPEDHRLASLDVIPLKELAKEPFIVLEEGGNINSVFDAYDEIGIKPNIKSLIQDDPTIIAMVEQGLGVSMLSAMTLEHSTYRFKKLPTNPPVERTICVAYESASLLPIAAKKFINFMYAHLNTYMKGEYVHPVKADPLK